jgi:PEP-CTERM motif
MTTNLIVSTPLLRAKALAPALTLAVVLACAASSASAQTQYATRAAFNAAATTHYDYDFNGGTMVSTLSSAAGDLAAVTTVGGDAFGAVSGGSLWGSTAGAKDAFTTLRFDFLQPVYGFGFDDLDLNGAEWAIIDVTFTGGLTQRYARTTFTPFEPVFFGIASASPLLRVQVFSDDTAAGLQPGSRANLIDNVVVSTTPVPEPSAFTLLAAGLGLMGMFARLLRGRQR